MSFKARCCTLDTTFATNCAYTVPRIDRSSCAVAQRRVETMKKFLLGTVGLVAFGMAAPATAAELAPYPKAPLPAPYVSPIYDWSGFNIGANGNWDSSHSCVDFLDVTGVQCR